MDPFEDYDRIVAETKPRSKLIKDERFEFPSSCPADVGLDFTLNALTNPDRVEDFALAGLARILSDEDLERLCKVTTMSELAAIAVGLFKSYGLVALPEDVKAPNLTTAPTSPERSSQGSEPSAQGSGASLDSDSRTIFPTSAGPSS